LSKRRIRQNTLRRKSNRRKSVRRKSVRRKSFKRLNGGVIYHGRCDNKGLTPSTLVDRRNPENKVLLEGIEIVEMTHKNKRTLYKLSINKTLHVWEKHDSDVKESDHRRRFIASANMRFSEILSMFKEGYKNIKKEGFENGVWSRKEIIKKSLEERFRDTKHLLNQMHNTIYLGKITSQKCKERITVIYSILRCVGLFILKVANAAVGAEPSLITEMFQKYFSESITKWEIEEDIMRMHE